MAEDINMISFRIRQPHVSPRSCYSLAYINLFFLKFCFNLTQPMLIWASETFDGKLYVIHW